jgi:small GTP-binding protein
MTVRKVKIVLLGNSGSGKTALINRWNVGVLDPCPNLPTTGPDCVTKRLDVDGHGSVSVSVWDTAGQEKFRSLVPSYARDSQLILLTVSVSDDESFQAIPSWVTQVNEGCKIPPPIVLVVNKMDLVEDAVYSTEEIHKTYECQFLGIFFVSAKSGDNVDLLFDFAVPEAVKFFTRILAPQDSKLEPEDAEQGQRTKLACC